MEGFMIDSILLLVALFAVTAGLLAGLELLICLGGGLHE